MRPWEYASAKVTASPGPNTNADHPPNSLYFKTQQNGKSLCDWARFHKIASAVTKDDKSCLVLPGDAAPQRQLAITPLPAYSYLRFSISPSRCQTTERYDLSADAALSHSTLPRWRPRWESGEDRSFRNQTDGAGKWARLSRLCCWHRPAVWPRPAVWLRPAGCLHLSNALLLFVSRGHEFPMSADTCWREVEKQS